MQVRLGKMRDRHFRLHMGRVPTAVRTAKTIASNLPMNLDSCATIDMLITEAAAFWTERGA